MSFDESAIQADLNRRAAMIQDVLNNKYIPVTPTPKQALFLTTDAREAMFGGSAGGGKSIALLMAALQFVHVPGYSALLVRRTFADLNLADALIPLSFQWLRNTDAKWDAQNHKWVFPNGASLTFGYLETEMDKYRYQGAQFQFFGADEATQLSKTQYLYVISRVRRPVQLAEVPLRVRAATNPGGVSHDFFFNRFVNSKTRGSRVFVPSKLEDNKHLDAASYEESLAELDPLTRRQLRHGDWYAKQEGGTFKQEWFRYYERYQDHYLIGPKKIPVKISECNRFACADIAGTEKRDNNDPDYTVIQVWDVTPAADMILVEQWRGQFEIPDVEEKLMQTTWKHECPYAVVEKNGIGLGVVQTCKRRGLPIRPIIAKRDKFARSQVAQIRMEQGSVYFPQNRPWMDELESELLAFPCDGMHDDVVDCFSMAAANVQKMTGPLKDRRDDEHEEKVLSQINQESEEVANDRLVREAMNEDEFFERGWVHLN